MASSNVSVKEFILDELLFKKSDKFSESAVSELSSSNFPANRRALNREDE